MVIQRNNRPFSNRMLFWGTVCALSFFIYFFPSEYFKEVELEYSVYANSTFPTQHEREFHLNGEYGLWVHERDNQLIVNWITLEPDSGFLKVFNNNSIRYTFTTPPAQSHRVAFEKGNIKQLDLKYGSLTNKFDQHEITIYLEPAIHKQKAKFNKVDSIFVLGDIHGQYDNLIKLLSNAKVIDSNLQWKANRNHLVILGDIFDKGDDVTKTLWFLYKLEKQAAKYSGYVHILLGNHEIMTFANDLRYLSEKENLIAKFHNTEYYKMYDIHDSILGKWLATKRGIIKINNILFAHGGVTTDYMNYSIQSYNDSLYQYLHGDMFNYLLADSLTIDSLLSTHADSILFARRFYFFFSENSVFWYRGYVQVDTLENDLKKVLKKYKSKLHVVAHTPVNTIQEFYDKKIIAVDLYQPVTEILLLVRIKKNKYQKFRYNINGTLEPL